MAETLSCDSEHIARLVANGDPGALERIAHCYLDHLRGVGRCACRDHHSADDAVQEALLVAAERLDQFRGEGTALAWLSRIVVNACRCQLRGRKNSSEWNRPIAAARHALSDSESPEDAAARRELGQALGDALASLTPDERALFVRTQLDGLTGAEAAAEWNTTADAVRARLTRIRRKLRARLTHSSA